MPTLHIPTLLEAILEATATEQAAKARIASLRAAIEDEARRRYAADGAAPSWNTPALGKVRLDPEGDWTAAVADPAAFGSWVAEHYPTEATAVIPIAASDLADALQALEFIGVTPAGDVRVEVRSAWEEALTKRAAVDVDDQRDEDGQLIERTVTIVDPDTGLLVDGMTANRKPARLVVSLDRDRRTAAISGAVVEVEALVTEASGDEAAVADYLELHQRRRDLEGLAAAQLSTIAKAHNLGGTGTKAELAERIARAELATGNVIRPASDLPEVEPDGCVGEHTPSRPSCDYSPAGARANLTAVPDPLPDDAEVEEVTTLPAEDPAPLDPPADGAYAPGGAVANAIADEVRRAQAAEVEFLDQPVEEVPDAGPTSRALLDGLSREVLRGYAKSVGISAAGTKGDLLDRLEAAGTTVTAVNDYARAARA